MKNLKILKMFKQRRIMTQTKFENIVEKWKENKQKYVKISSFCTYSLLIEKHILPYFKNKNKITEQDVERFIFQKISLGLSEKTVKDIFLVLKMILNFAFKNKLLHRVFLDVKFPQCKQEKKLKVFSKQEHKRLLRFVKANFSFKNLGIYICLSTGLRIGEICGLKWGDIDIQEGVLKVSRTIQRVYIEKTSKTQIIFTSPKTKSSQREVPLNRSLIQILRLMRKISNPDYFVLTNSEKPLEPRNFRKYYNKLLEKLGLPKIPFHGLRHSFATRCIESRCDYKTVSVILGHSNITTTLNLYVHPNLEQKKKCINQMSSFLGSEGI